MNLKISLLSPPSPQREIFDFNPDNVNQVVFALGGYGSGKSRLGVCKAMQLSWLNPGIPGLYVAPTYRMLHDIVLETWREVLAESDIDFNALYKISDKELNLPWGGRIWFRSADEPSTLRGPNVAFSIGDEDIGFEAFKQIKVRVRHPKASQLYCGIFSTPDFSWIDEALAVWPEAKVWTMSSLDNYMLGDDVRQGLLQMYSAAEADCYVHGKIVKMSGGVFHSFMEGLDGNLTQETLDPAGPFHCGVDFGGQYPAIGFYQERNGKELLLDEWCPQRGYGWKIYDIAKELERYGRKPDVIYVDPAGDAENTQTFMSDIVYLKEDGFNVVFTTNPHLRQIPLGIQIINGFLQNAQGDRKFLINKALCPTHVRDIKASVYPKEKNGSVKLLDKPVKDGRHDHSRDAMRYMFINRYGREWLRNRNLLREQ